MRTRNLLLVLSAAILAAPAWAKDPPRQFKTVEAKHFTRAEGVELSPEFFDYLYAELRTELAKTKLFVEVIGEGEAVEEADAAQSAIIEGNVTEFKKGSAVKEGLTSVIFGVPLAGFRGLRASAVVRRRSDQKVLFESQFRVSSSSRMNEKVLARDVAEAMAKKIKKALKEGPPAGT